MSEPAFDASAVVLDFDEAIKNARASFTKLTKENERLEERVDELESELDEERADSDAVTERADAAESTLEQVLLDLFGPTTNLAHVEHVIRLRPAEVPDLYRELAATVERARDTIRKTLKGA